MKRCGAGSILRPDRYSPRPIAAAATIACGPSRSNTRRASCSSPAVTSSPVRQEMFSMPCSAAPTMSAWIARRFLSRQTTCMIGSTPSILIAMATATLEACACAAVLSVALTASTQGAYCSSLARTASRPPPSTIGSSPVITMPSPASFRSSSDMPLAVASGLPARGRPAVALAQEVGPRGRVLEPVVDRRAHVVVFLAPVLRKPGHALGALESLEPDTAHLGLDLAVPVRPNTSARPVAEGLRAVHGARHAGRVQHALPAHLAAPDRSLDRLLDERERLHAGTSARRFSIRSFARRTAVEASAA